MNQFTALINLLPLITKGLESVTSVGEVLSSDDVEQNEGKEVLPDLKGAFEFKNVRYAYPGTEGHVLDDINLTIPEGETIAVVGESGSGKTTMMNLLIGFMEPDRGQILVDGKDMKSIDLKSYRRFLSVVPQMPLLFTGTLRDNIAYGMENATDEEIMAAGEPFRRPAAEDRDRSCGDPQSEDDHPRRGDVRSGRGFGEGDPECA